MPLIALVRHGQASFGADVYDELSDLGRKQAHAVGVELARRGLRNPVLANGTMKRQQETAALLADAAGFDSVATVDGRWNEYDHIALVKRYIDAARRAPAEQDSRAFQRLLDEALAAWTAGDDSGWVEFGRAGSAALQELAADLPSGRDAVVVTSAGVVAALAGRLLQAGPATVIALNRVAVNAALTTVVVGERGTSLLSFNDHAHFTGPARGLLTYR